MSLVCVASNKTIEGHIMDEAGNGVEFASIYVDSIYVVSNKDGYFSLVIPSEIKQEIVVSHISYQTYRIPYDVYSKNNKLNLVLKEKISNLSDIAVISEKKQKSIIGRGVRAPGDVAFRNVRNTQYEIGPWFSVNKDWHVGNIKLRVQKSSFAYCTIRLIVYEIIDMQFVPILHRPLYLQMSKTFEAKEFSILIEEPLRLERNHKYYVGVAVMSSSGNGEIHFPAYFKKGCARNLCKDKVKNLPVTLGVSLYGMPVK